MMRLWAGGLSLLVAWQSAQRAVADDWRRPGPALPAAATSSSLGVSLGRPQAIPAPGDIALTAYAAPAIIGKPAAPDALADAVAGPPPVWPEVPMPAAATVGVSRSFAVGGPVIAPPGNTAPTETAPMPKSTPNVAPGFDVGVPVTEFSGNDFVGDETDSGWPGWMHGLGSSGAAASNRFYGGADYLLWWIKGTGTPPLVSSGPASGAGILGTPGTFVLFGGPSAVTQPVFSGARFNLGYWIDPGQVVAVDGSFFFLGTRSVSFVANSDGTPLLARPFYSANTQSEFAKTLAAPGVSSGGIRIDAPSHLWGTEFNLRTNLWRDGGMRLDVLAGGRFLELQEGIHIADITQLPGDAVDFTLDKFDTLNQFYGGQLGLAWEGRSGPWTVDVRTKVALGDSYRSVTIRGGQATLGPGGSNVFLGGLLALPSNIGNLHQDRFAVVPEVSLNIGYQVTDALRAYVGYSFIYWSNVVRPGDQIDRAVDASLIPNTPQPGVPSAGQLRPAVVLKGRDFWAQGVNFGLEYRY